MYEVSKKLRKEKYWIIKCGGILYEEIDDLERKVNYWGNQADKKDEKIKKLEKKIEKLTKEK